MLMLPPTAISPPGCSFSARTSEAGSPRKTVVFFQSGSSSVDEKTNFCTWSRWAVIPVLSFACFGQ